MKISFIFCSLILSILSLESLSAVQLLENPEGFFRSEILRAINPKFIDRRILSTRVNQKGTYDQIKETTQKVKGLDGELQEVNNNLPIDSENTKGRNNRKPSGDIALTKSTSPERQKRNADEDPIDGDSGISEDHERPVNNDHEISKLLKIISGLLDLHSGVQPPIDNDESKVEDDVAMENELHLRVDETTVSTSNQTDSPGFFGHVFGGMRTFKIPKDAFYRLFLPSCSKADGNCDEQTTKSAVNSNSSPKIHENSLMEAQIEVDTAGIGDAKAKNNDQLTGNKVVKVFGGTKTEDDKHTETNISTILKDMDQLFAEYFEESSGSSTTTATPELDMDAILEQLKSLSKSSAFKSLPEDDSTMRDIELTTTQSNEDIPVIITKIDQLIQEHSMGINLPNTASQKQDTSSIFKEMESSRDKRSLRKPYSRREPNSLPCIAPYVDIAYKMCILPILDKVFSYDDALEHCRERGLQLVMDSVVIKSRKYLNELLGERGTRTRWPVWVGAKKQEGGESRWMWEDGNTVPNFLWSKRQPRTYNAHSIPEGTCMILDGFNEYYGSSLPCHLRRRFICQKTY